MRDRFVICRNPDQADRDQAIREQHLEDAIDGSDQLTAAERSKLAARLHAKRGLKRFLPDPGRAAPRRPCCCARRGAPRRQIPAAQLGPATLTAEDIALGYKQLLQVERGWRDMKTTLDLRPVHHRKEDRIRAHVQLCWLALLLIRIAENQTGDTWRNVRRELQRLHQGTFRGNAGLAQKTSETTAAQCGSCARSGLSRRPRSQRSTPPHSRAPIGSRAAQPSILGTRWDALARHKPWKITLLRAQAPTELSNSGLSKAQIHRRVERAPRRLSRARARSRDHVTYGVMFSV